MVRVAPSFEGYATKYENVRLERDDGVGSAVAMSPVAVSPAERV